MENQNPHRSIVQYIIETSKQSCNEIGVIYIYLSWQKYILTSILCNKSLSSSIAIDNQI